MSEDTSSKCLFNTDVIGSITFEKLSDDKDASYAIETLAAKLGEDACIAMYNQQMEAASQEHISSVCATAMTVDEPPYFVDAAEASPLMMTRASAKIMYWREEWLTSDICLERTQYKWENRR